MTSGHPNAWQVQATTKPDQGKKPSVCINGIQQYVMCCYCLFVCFFRLIAQMEQENFTRQSHMKFLTT